ncbi:MAG: ATP-binding protein [Oscillochloridaceae bacterium umkhey_bin13]
MVAHELFPRDTIIGVFRGFREGGLEFQAQIALPYRSEFQSTPMHGQFLLVQLETPDEAVLGRITAFSSEGKLSMGTGEEFTIRALQERREIPEDLREQYLKYRVTIRVLGVLRAQGRNLTFVPSHRRLPHVGSPVAFPTPEVLREIAGHNIAGVPIGHFALGEYIYAAGNPSFHQADWMQVKEPEILVRFPIESLVARRSFIFARAGFGKSNLNKLLFSRLYAETPTVEKRGGRRVPVGTVIFDTDGEYFWPDDKGRPGLCDVPELEDKVVVFTSRRGPSAFYQSFVAGGIKLDLRRFKPADVLAIAVSPERQDQQNVRKLKQLNQENWERLINLIDQKGNQAPLDAIATLLDLTLPNQEAEALAARGNMTTLVKQLHDRSSMLIHMLLHALQQGKLCIVDVSQLRGGPALQLSGLLLRRIFERNQEEFTAAEPKTIPTIAVVEEAQAVLNERASAAEPYIAWVKEGRKYDLGALLITQQPGSISTEILSQGDNWFIFHLLAAADLVSLQRANAHFSEDLLSALLNEPIAGQGVFWSSVGGKPYPVALRVLLFEQLYQMRDPHGTEPPALTFANELRQLFVVELSRETPLEGALREAGTSYELGHAASADNASSEAAVDTIDLYKQRAIQALRQQARLIEEIKGEGIAWGRVMVYLKNQLPPQLDDRDDLAYHLVREALDVIFGPQYEAWHSFKHEPTGKMWVKIGRRKD